MRKHFIVFLAVLIGAATSVQAQPSPNMDPMMRQMQQSLQSPEGRRMMQQMMQNQEIDLSNQTGWNNHNCDESMLRRCQAGYTCSGSDEQGRPTDVRIEGRENGRCHVRMVNPDGSRGDCHYSEGTVDALIRLQERRTIKMQEAMELGRKVASECQFTDASGKPINLQNMQPQATGAR